MGKYYIMLMNYEKNKNYGNDKIEIPYLVSAWG